MRMDRLVIGVQRRVEPTARFVLTYVGFKDAITGNKMLLNGKLTDLELDVVSSRKIVRESTATGGAECIILGCVALLPRWPTD